MENEKLRTLQFMYDIVVSDVPRVTRRARQFVGESEYVIAQPVSIIRLESLQTLTKQFLVLKSVVFASSV